MAQKMLPWDICPRYWWQKQLESKESDDESIKKLVLSALKDFNIEADKIIAYTIDNAFHTQLTTHFIHNWQRIGHDSHNPAYE